MSNVLANFKMDNKVLNRRITTVTKKLKVASSELQEVLVAVAAQIEEHNNCDGLTKIVVGLSKVNSKDEVVLSSHAKQVGMYMQDLAPVFWDKDTQSFKIQKKAAKDWDWSKSLSKLNIQWDEFGAQKANTAFDAAAKLRTAVSAITAIVNTDEEVDHRILAEAEALLAKMGNAEKLLGQLKEEKKAAKVA